MNEIFVIFEDFGIFTPEISENIDKRRIDGYVLKAARVHLSNLIGAKMYADLVQNQALPDYISLINGGGTYCEKLYYGIKPYICLIAYGLMLRESSAKLTPSGIVKKQLDYSEHVRSGELKSQIDYQFQQAEFYAAGILGYLGENKALFPKFECGKTDLNIETQIIAVTRGNEKYPPSGGANRYENYRQ